MIHIYLCSSYIICVFAVSNFSQSISKESMEDWLKTWLLLDLRIDITAVEDPSWENLNVWSVFYLEECSSSKAKKNCLCHLYWYVYFLSGQIGLLLCVVCCGASVDSEDCEQMEMTKSKAMLWQSAERAVCRWRVAEDDCHWQCRLLVSGKWEAFRLFYVTFTSLLASHWSKLTCIWKHWVVLTGKYVWHEDKN